jgi:hypothetical protein
MWVILLYKMDKNGNFFINKKKILIKDFYINFTVRQLIKMGSYLGNKFVNVYSRQFVIATRLKIALINPLETFSGLKKGLFFFLMLYNIIILYCL